MPKKDPPSLAVQQQNYVVKASTARTNTVTTVHGRCLSGQRRPFPHSDFLRYQKHQGKVLAPTCDSAWPMGGPTVDSADCTGSGRFANAASIAAPAALVLAARLSCACQAPLFSNPYLHSFSL